MKVISRYIYCIFFLAVIVAGLAGGAEAKVIGVSLLTREHQFYRDLESGLQKEAARKGYTLIVSAGEFDLEGL